MSAAGEHIAALDAALAAAGEDIILRRVVASSNVDIAVRASVRAFAPDELVGTISQSDSQVIISPTEIFTANWPAGLPPVLTAFQVDPRVPKTGDKAVIQGKLRTVSFVKPILVAGEVVRIEMTVAG